jgi:glyoxylase-like metal-dependent hydrolase (beta-lactamase superfamily II)
MSLSLQDLEEGRRIAALVVRHCGDTYFPLFDRFDQEVRKRQSAADRIEAALTPSHSPGRNLRHPPEAERARGASAAPRLSRRSVSARLSY